MIRPNWPRRTPRSPHISTDPAPSILTSIVVDIEARAAEFMRGRAFASHDTPVQGSWLASTSNQLQSWHSDAGDGVDVWCSIDTESARELLEIVLGGPGAIHPTALERGIVRETIERALSSTNRLWEERTAASFPSVRGWICRLTIMAPRGTSAVVSFYAPAVVEPPTPIVKRVDLRSVPVVLAASLPPIDVRVGSIARWERGAIVALGCDAACAVSLFADRTRVAEGRLGAVRNQRAVRIERQAPELER